MSYSSDGRMFATGSVDNTVKIILLLTGMITRTILHEGAVLTMTYSPDGSMIATGSDDNTVKIT